jgi:tetratricopeptide (TPR) repeat protein
VDMPHQLTYAFGGDKALQVWYGDSTLRLVAYDRGHLDTGAACAVQYQPDEPVEIVTLRTDAVIAQSRAYEQIQAADFSAALASLARADSLERDPRAIVFRAKTRGLRAFALELSGQREEALREAEAALALHPHNDNARLVLASEALQRGDVAAGEAQLDTLLADNPTQAAALQMKARIEAARGAGEAGASPWR